ncbi:MAG: signal transduction histidine kinase [Alphaproteobacteria bacterium]
MPFYTTKKQGCGIGLALSRQIALNHGGDLRLVNNIAPNTQTVLGAKAILSLPMPLQS